MMLAQVETMPPSPFDRRKSDGEIVATVARLEARLNAQDDVLADLKKQIADIKTQGECILGSIVGTPQLKGMAGEVRDLKTWREEIERHKPLELQLAEIRAWQDTITKITMLFFGPVALTILLGALSLIWLLITNRAELIVH